MLDLMDVHLDGFLGLVLTCYYRFEPAVPEDDINPPEPATVDLVRVYLGMHPLEPHQHLSIEQWQALEQHILESRLTDW